MGTFKTTKTLQAPATLVPGIANEIATVLSGEGYKVQSIAVTGGGYDISISKSNMFKAIAGMNSALKINLQPVMNGIYIEAGIGIFGQQAIPTVISMLFFWPIALTQIWGIVKQAKLDDRVVEIAEKYIAQNTGNAASPNAFGIYMPPMGGGATKFCTACGKQLTADAAFCSGCGEKV
jgi:hypothetical protein